MPSFMGQSQLTKLGKLTTFACKKGISENPKCFISVKKQSLAKVLCRLFKTPLTLQTQKIQIKF